MAALMAVTLLALLVQDIPLSNYMRQAEHDRIITSLERDALLLASRAQHSLQSGTKADYAGITSIAKAYHSAGGARVIIVDGRGIAVFTSDTDDSVVGSSYLSRPEIAKAMSGTITTGTRYSQTLREELLYVAVPVLSGSTVYGAVRLTYPQQVITDTVNAQLGLLGLALLAAVVIAGFVGYILSTSIARALLRLRFVTERIADGALSDRADERHGASELRSLARSFNVMADRLHLLIAQQRAFASDASHQLRTPLTALKLRLERARELASVDAEATALRLSAAEAEVDRLADIIEGLLLLSRIESSEAPRDVVDLAAIAAERVDSWRPLAEESGVVVQLHAPATALASALATAPGQIIDNYIDNALAGAPRGSTIDVTVAADASATTVSVLDQGPGLAEADRVRAFERFWRGDQAGPGSGLGLAIVAELARASGAVATLEHRAGGGMVASVRFDSAAVADES
jgi:signal transduction histidine kinase